MNTSRVLPLAVALFTLSTVVDAQVYHQDPSHLWNRLHSALFVRTSRDGIEFGQDLIDPLLVNNSTHLLTGRSYTELLKVLDEFNNSAGSQKLGSPLQRAVLQHDLWAIFDWVSARQVGMQWVGYEPASQERRELQERLVQAISKLALPGNDVGTLTNNYSDAVASGRYAEAYDATAAETPFLPRDLLAPESSWVELAEPAAPVHTADFGGRSVFRVFVRLPGRRKNTIEFLETLRNVKHSDLVDVGRKPFEELNVQLPKFPPQTQFALVRQMTVIDKLKRIRPTQITQSVQIRVHHKRGKVNSSNAALEEEVAFQRRKLKRASQDFYEFTLHRKTLFADRHGGLHPSDQATKTIISPLRRHGTEPDPISNRRGSEILEKSTVNLMQCVHCHREPNIFSFESFVQNNSLLRRPIPLFPKSDNRVGNAALAWKQSQFGWGLFRGLAGEE